MKTLLLSAGLAILAAAEAAAGGILPEGRDWREIAFGVTDGRPMIAARIGGREGRMMFDLGTPDPVFLNRDAAPLDTGVAGPSGSAASGQTITVRMHAAPGMDIAGLPWTPPDQVRSGPFGFAEAGLGEDFLGFIGRPMVADIAFTLDYGRRVLTLLRVTDDLALAVPPPEADDVLARVAFAQGPGGLPTAAARLGELPILVDFDTGDRGTIYLRPETRAELHAAGILRTAPDKDEEQVILTTLTLGGRTFGDIALRAVEAGGPEDFRTSRAPDLVRLGAGFLSRHPSLWNLPAGTVTFLRQDSAFLAPR